MPPRATGIHAISTVSRTATPPGPAATYWLLEIGPVGPNRPAPDRRCWSAQAEFGERVAHPLVLGLQERRKRVAVQKRCGPAVLGQRVAPFRGLLQIVEQPDQPLPVGVGD